MVLVTRRTEYELLLERHATRAQARFFLRTRGQDLAEVERRHQSFDAALPVVLGRDIVGNPVYADLASMPHLLIAGATGSGKSIGLQSNITSILYRATREQVQFIFIDPKRKLVIASNANWAAGARDSAATAARDAFYQAVQKAIDRPSPGGSASAEADADPPEWPPDPEDAFVGPRACASNMMTRRSWI